MVVGFARTTRKLTRNQLEHSILRNFGGFDPDDFKFQPMEIFKQICPIFDDLKPSDDEQPETAPIKLIQTSLFGTKKELVKYFSVLAVVNKTSCANCRFLKNHMHTYIMALQLVQSALVCYITDFVEINLESNATAGLITNISNRL